MCTGQHCHLEASEQCRRSENGATVAILRSQLVFSSYCQTCGGGICSLCVMRQELRTPALFQMTTMLPHPMSTMPHPISVLCGIQYASLLLLEMFSCFDSGPSSPLLPFLHYWLFLLCSFMQHPPAFSGL